MGLDTSDAAQFEKIMETKGGSGVVGVGVGVIGT